MSLSVSVNVSDAATPAINALADALDERALAASVGDAEVALFQNHLRGNGTNKNGWPSTAFWSRAAQTVDWTAADTGLAINIRQAGVQQRYAGGDIHPTGGHQYLTIPARAEAYGHRAGEFSNLRVAYGRNGAFALVEANATQSSAGRSKKSPGHGAGPHADTVGGGVYFWLVKSVSQAPDPSVLPADEDIAAVARDTINGLMARVSKNGGAH